MGLNFANPRGMNAIQEERGFTNPHIRFRRIRGRIVPIHNKKRIGQDITDIGERAFVGGAKISAATLLAKKTKLGKRLTKPLSKFKIKTSFLGTKASDGFKMKSIKAAARISGKATRFSLKNSGKLGLALLGVGVVTKLIGDELQMRSGFGKDFFFAKDRQGRDS